MAKPSIIIATMTDVTRILNQIEQGDLSATEQLLPLVYQELRVLARQRLANEKPGQTLQATALVHEAYLRLIGNENDQSWDNRGHFFGAAAEAMRRILVDRAKSKRRVKRGGHLQRLDLDQIDSALEAPSEDLLALDELLTLLGKHEPECAEVIKLRFFAGLSIPETARSLGISPRTANLRWAYGRAWLFKQLQCDAQ